MLVLSRKNQQVIRIGDEIILKIVEIRGDKVRLGIEAPEHVHIVREELLPISPEGSREDVKHVAR